MKAIIWKGEDLGAEYEYVDIRATCETKLKNIAKS